MITMCKQQPVQLDCRREDCCHHGNGSCHHAQPQIIMIGENGRCQDFEVDFIDLLNDYETCIHNGKTERCQNVKMAKEKVIKAYDDAKSR